MKASAKTRKAKPKQILVDAAERQRSIEKWEKLKSKLDDIEQNGMLNPGHIQIPLEKVLALVFNMMDSQADKDVGPEMLAEYVGKFTQADVDHFVLHQVTKLPGYNVRDALRILDCLTRWRERYFP